MSLSSNDSVFDTFYRSLSFSTENPPTNIAVAHKLAHMV
jgi:hypothetical protein